MPLFCRFSAVDGANMKPFVESSAPEFVAFIDREIAAARQEIDKFNQKIAVLEELRNNFVSQPDDADSEMRQASRQMLATEAIRTFLRRQDRPVPTTEILDYLKSQGISFGGQQPRNALSVMLSRSTLFKAHGRRGWTLAHR
jgi:hypothetical protein